MEVWIPNQKNRLKKVLLGSVPTSASIQKSLKKPLPKVIEKVLEETIEDLDEIKKTYESLGVEVLTYPVEHPVPDHISSINVRNSFFIVDSEMYITERYSFLEPLYKSVKNATFLHHDSIGQGEGIYAPDIYIHDDYAILDGLPKEVYYDLRKMLSPKRKIITAFNDGHGDGIYCNIGDKIWLTDGYALPFEKLWPDIPYFELTMNDWKPQRDFFNEKELLKTRGHWMINKHELTNTEIEFMEKYLKSWTGYAEETIFDLNISIVDENNVMAISQNSLVYDKLESLGIKVHHVPLRHRFFWDGGLHCITNDLEREK